MNCKYRKSLMEQRSARAIAAAGLRMMTGIRPLLEFVLPLVVCCMFFNAMQAAATENSGRVYQQGPAMELVSGFVTAPSTTFTNWTMAANNSLTLRNSTFGKKLQLLSAWAQNQVAGTLSIRSPKLHDNVQGIRTRITTGTVSPLFPIGYPENLYPQDTLTVQQTGSAVGGQIESGSLLVYYEDLPGASARFTDPATVAKRGVHILGQETTITTGAGGGYTGQEAVNAQFDNFVANTDYALVGYEVNVSCCSVRILGNDTSNMGVGGPGEPAMRDLTCRWFDFLSDSYGLPLIPVFNSANKSSILVDAVQSQAAAAVIATWYFVQLAP